MKVCRKIIKNRHGPETYQGQSGSYTGGVRGRRKVEEVGHRGSRLSFLEREHACGKKEFLYSPSLRDRRKMARVS